MKTDYLHIRIEKELKEQLEKKAKEAGFDDLSSFLRHTFKKLVSEAEVKL